MANDLLTAVALVLILEGLLPGLAPSIWMKMVRDIARLGPRSVRVAGIACMVTGAVLLQFLH